MVIGSLSVSRLPQGAVIQSAAAPKQYYRYYGVQSADFVRTVSPGATSGVYRLNSPIGLLGGGQRITAENIPSPAAVTPYPPRNASAYYSGVQQRIIPNDRYCPTCSR